MTYPVDNTILCTCHEMKSASITFKLCFRHFPNLAHYKSFNSTSQNCIVTGRALAGSCEQFNESHYCPKGSSWLVLLQTSYTDPLSCYGNRQLKHTAFDCLSAVLHCVKRTVDCCFAYFRSKDLYIKRLSSEIFPSQPHSATIYDSEPKAVSTTPPPVSSHKYPHCRIFIRHFMRVRAVVV